jgi:hypothetical protein
MPRRAVPEQPGDQGSAPPPIAGVHVAASRARAAAATAVEARGRD